MKKFSLSKDEVTRLVDAAQQAREHSYSPYSKFKVGAAVLTKNGEIFTGTNIENASYPAGLCAERTAIFHAIASGEKQICAVAIVGGLNFTASDYCAPCGMCRQVMHEFANPENLLVIMAKSPTDYVEKTLEELLPMSFGSDSLK